MIARQAIPAFAVQRKPAEAGSRHPTTLASAMQVPRVLAEDLSIDRIL